MASEIIGTACGAGSPSFPGVTCVLNRTHRPKNEHRGVAWIDGVPSDHYWTTTSHKRIGAVVDEVPTTDPQHVGVSA